MAWNLRSEKKQRITYNQVENSLKSVFCEKQTTVEPCEEQMKKNTENHYSVVRIDVRRELKTRVINYL